MAIQSGINNIISSALSAYRDNKIASLSGQLESTQKEFADFKSRFKRGGRPKGSHNREKALQGMQNVAQISQGISTQNQLRKKGETK